MVSLLLRAEMTKAHMPGRCLSGFSSMFKFFPMLILHLSSFWWFPWWRLWSFWVFFMFSNILSFMFARPSHKTFLVAPCHGYVFHLVLLSLKMCSSIYSREALPHVPICILSVFQQTVHGLQVSSWSLNLCR